MNYFDMDFGTFSRSSQLIVAKSYLKEQAKEKNDQKISK
jgi:hypothetical protein